MNSQQTPNDVRGIAAMPQAPTEPEKIDPMLALLYSIDALTCGAVDVTLRSCATRGGCVPGDSKILDVLKDAVIEAARVAFAPPVPPVTEPAAVDTGMFTIHDPDVRVVSLTDCNLDRK